MSIVVPAVLIAVFLALGIVALAYICASPATKCRLGLHPQGSRWSGELTAGCASCGKVWDRRSSDPAPPPGFA